MHVQLVKKLAGANYFSSYYSFFFFFFFFFFFLKGGKGRGGILNSLDVRAKERKGIAVQSTYPEIRCWSFSELASWVMTELILNWESSQRLSGR